MVYTSSAVNNGDYNLFFEKWMIDFLGAGETATLDLTLFTLIDNQPITNFVQIFVANELDPDSTPGNNTTGIPSEDDEASITIEAASSLQQPGDFVLRSTNKMDIQDAYPNPAIEFIMLPIDSEIDLETQIEVIDSYGRVVKVEQVSIAKGKNVLNIDLDTFAPGVYFITLKDVKVRRFSKQFVKTDF